MNPFDYWEGDPYGYLRHVIAGALLFLLIRFFLRDRTLVQIAILGIAVLKEIYDVQCGKPMDPLDILSTISPMIFFEITLRQSRLNP